MTAVNSMQAPTAESLIASARALIPQLQLAGPDHDRNKRISTSDVNDALQELLARRQPPQAAGHEIKLNYATQVETAPPQILVFGNNPDLVAEHYIRYLHNGFREKWGFIGNPLNIVMRRKGGRD